MSVILEHVTIKYGQLKAVNDVSTTFPPGSTGLLGPNGAGKSSLIKGLLGLVSFSSGRASILDRDVNMERKAIRQLIGYMPEDDCLIPGLTGIGMVQYAGELSGMNRDDAVQRAHELLFVVGLEEARYRKVETYSAGMKQRIKLAQALVHDPKLLFLDEPTSGMDPKGRQEMLDLIDDISSRGRMSIVLASHILVDVERTCQHAMIMNRGKMLKEGSVEELRGSYAGTYTVRIEGDQEKFVKALEKMKCSVQPNGNFLWDVTLPKGKQTDFILKAAKETQVQIRKMVTSVETLEDVFVKLIGEEEHADL